MIRSTGILVLMMFFALVTPAMAQSGEPYEFTDYDQLRQRYNIAQSDYFVGVASKNLALKDSAERQFAQINLEISMKMQKESENYEKQTERLREILSELSKFIPDPSVAKEISKTIISAVPLIGNAVAASITMDSLAKDKVANREGKEILARAQEQWDELKKTSAEYKKWQDFKNEKEKKHAELQDRAKVISNRGEWRQPVYDTNPGTIRQTGMADIEYKGKNQPSGRIITGKAKNKTGDKVTMEFHEGTILIPKEPGFQRMVITLPERLEAYPDGKESNFELYGFCLDPGDYPPTPEGSEDYHPIEPTAVNIDSDDPFWVSFREIPLIPGIVKTLTKEGKMPKTGLPPDMEELTFIQWVIWNAIENFSRDDGKEKIRKQVEESGGKQTPEQINELNENIWTGIDLVHKEINPWSK